MKLVFADTFYWVALINPRDNWHKKAIEMTRSLELVQIVTTDEVLTEVLNFLCTYGNRMRQRNVQLIKDIIANPNIQVMQQTRESFLQGLELYESRLDKEYSLTDCISMQTMKQLGIIDVLTHDRHFVQEGFRILFQDT
ncbi:PIN domain-containing protein [Brasilonema sp. UFV-L1]|uniref:type II toxin-antitoxin system VapC family toxin n=1 Tax=Brasilonema sp. UFV-L1 TaxID=2234130 RepID=UPI00145DE31A|nr:PIN domain-containing protein [Brasilonema sp. UFV-L1]NMG08470.1 nucleic acid-binding protein [Brasilonema sp. UFV-L1]